MVFITDNRDLHRSYGVPGIAEAAVKGRDWNVPDVLNLPWNRFRLQEKKKTVYVYNMNSSKGRQLPNPPVEMTRTKQLLIKTYLYDLHTDTDEVDRRHGRNHIPYPYDASKDAEEDTFDFDDIMELSKPPVTEPQLDATSHESVDPGNMVCVKPKKKSEEKSLYPPGTFDRIRALERARKLRQEKNDRGDEVTVMNKARALEKARRIKEKQQQAIEKANRKVLDLFIVVLHGIRKQEGIFKDLIKERFEDKRNTFEDFRQVYRETDMDFTRMMVDVYACNDDAEELFSLSQEFSHDTRKADAIKTIAYRELNTQKRRFEIMQKLERWKRILIRMKKKVDVIYNADIFTLRAYIGKLKLEAALIQKDRIEFIRMLMENDDEWQAHMEEYMEEIKAGIEEAKAAFAKIPPEEHERVRQLVKRTAEYYQQEKDAAARKIYLKEMWKRYRMKQKITKIVRQCNQDFNTHMEVRRENAKPSTLDDVLHPRRIGVDLEKGPMTKSTARCIKQQNKKWDKLQKQYDKSAKAVQKRKQKQQKQKQKQKPHKKRRCRRLKLLLSHCNIRLPKLPQCAAACRLRKRLANVSLRLRSKWMLILNAMSTKMKKCKHGLAQLKDRGLNSKPVVLLKKKCSAMKSSTSMGIKSVTGMFKKQSNRIQKSVSRVGDKTGNSLNKCFWRMKKMLRSKPVKNKKINHWERSIIVTNLRGNNVITRFCNGTVQVIRFNNSTFIEPHVKRVHDFEPHVVGFGMSKERILRKKLMSYAKHDKTLRLIIKDIFKEGRNKKQLKEEEKYNQRNYLPNEFRTIAKTWKELVFMAGAPGLRAPLINLAYRLSDYLQDDDIYEDSKGRPASSSSAMTSDSLISGEDDLGVARKETESKRTRSHKPRHLSVKKGIRREFKGSEWSSQSTSGTKLSEGSGSDPKDYLNKAKRRFLEKKRRDGLRKQNGLLPRASGSSGSGHSASVARKLSRKESREIVEDITVLYQQLEDDMRSHRNPAYAIKGLQNRFTRLSSTHSLIGLAKSSTSRLSKPRFTGSNFSFAKIKEIPNLGRTQKEFEIKSYTNLKKNQKREIETFLQLIRAEKTKSEESKDEYSQRSRKVRLSTDSSSHSDFSRKPSHTAIRPKKKTVADFVKLLKELYFEEKIAHLIRSTMSVELQEELGKDPNPHFKARENGEPLIETEHLDGKDKKKKRKGFVALLKKVTNRKGKSKKKKKKRYEKGLYGYLYRHLEQRKERKAKKRLQKAIDKARASQSKEIPVNFKKSRFWKMHRSLSSVKFPIGIKRKKSRRQDNDESVEDFTDNKKRHDQSLEVRDSKTRAKSKRGTAGKRDAVEHHSSDSNQQDSIAQQNKPKERKSLFGVFSFMTREERMQEREKMREKYRQAKEKAKARKIEKKKSKASKSRKSKRSLKKHAGGSDGDDDDKTSYSSQYESKTEKKEPKKRKSLFGLISFKTRKDRKQAREEKKKKRRQAKEKATSHKRNKSKASASKLRNSKRSRMKHAGSDEDDGEMFLDSVDDDELQGSSTDFSKTHHSSDDDETASDSAQSESKTVKTKRIFGIFKIRKRNKNVKKDSKKSKDKHRLDKTEDNSIKHIDKPPESNTSKVLKLRRSKKSVTKSSSRAGSHRQDDEILDVSTDDESHESQSPEIDSQEYDDEVERVSDENGKTSAKHKTKRGPDALKKPLGWRKSFFGMFGPRKTPKSLLKKSVKHKGGAKGKPSKIPFKRRNSKVSGRKPGSHKDSDDKQADDMEKDDESNEEGNDKGKAKLSKVRKLRRSKKSVTEHTSKAGRRDNDDEILDVSTDDESPETQSPEIDSQEYDDEEESNSDKNGKTSAEHKTIRKSDAWKTPLGWRKSLFGILGPRKTPPILLQKNLRLEGNAKTTLSGFFKGQRSRKTKDKNSLLKKSVKLKGKAKRKPSKILRLFKRRKSKVSGRKTGAHNDFDDKQSDDTEKDDESNEEGTGKGKAKLSKVRKLRRSKKSVTEHTSKLDDDEILNVSTDDESPETQSPDIDSQEYEDEVESVSDENGQTATKQKTHRRSDAWKTPLGWRKSLFGILGPRKTPPILLQKNLRLEGNAKTTLSGFFMGQRSRKTKDDNRNKLGKHKVNAKRKPSKLSRLFKRRKSRTVVQKSVDHEDSDDQQTNEREEEDNDDLHTVFDENRNKDGKYKKKRKRSGAKKVLGLGKSILSMFGPLKTPKENRESKGNTKSKEKGKVKTSKVLKLRRSKKSVTDHTSRPGIPRNNGGILDVSTDDESPETQSPDIDSQEYEDEVESVSDENGQTATKQKTNRRSDAWKTPLGWRKSLFGILGPRKTPPILLQENLRLTGKDKTTLSGFFMGQRSRKTKDKDKGIAKTSTSKSRKDKSLSGVFQSRKHKRGKRKTTKEKTSKDKDKSPKSKHSKLLGFGRSKDSVDQSESRNHTDAVMKIISRHKDKPPRKRINWDEHNEAVDRRREKFIGRLKSIKSLFSFKRKRSNPKPSASQTSADSWATESSFRYSSSKGDDSITTTPAGPDQSNSWTSCESTSESSRYKKARDRTSRGKEKSRVKGSKLRESVTSFFGRFKKSKKSSKTNDSEDDTD